ncbi:hypothetical protein [Lolliginicoccus suaedae]|uniref:hypothetical protein n=1 Tax=Lolliginicoccus suaedae TaxID=2605429 RepID=UPI0011EC42E9|nr:hypothetical protein [Lolliginicoccus suaedae]
MMKRSPGQQVFLGVGSPWLSAITAMSSGTEGLSCFNVRGAPRPGDLLLTVLDTQPPVVLCINRIDVVDHDGWPGSDVTTGERCLLRELPEVSAIEAESGCALDLATQAPLGAEDADHVLAALAPYTEFRFDRTVRHPSREVATARAVLGSFPGCAGCHRKVDHATISLDAILLPESGTGNWDDPRTWYPALLCGPCTIRFRSSGRSDFAEYVFAEQHPGCPRCGARRTRGVVIGFPDFQFFRHPWLAFPGCCEEGPDHSWSCSDCDHTWSREL